MKTKLFVLLFYSEEAKKCKDVIWDIMMKQCCQLECFKNLTYNEMKETRMKFDNLENSLDERNFILSYINDNTSSSKRSPGYGKTKYMIKGKIVCKEAWLNTYGVNKRRFDRINLDFRKGTVFYQHGNSGSQKLGVKTSACLAWLKFLVNAIGDQQPDSGKIHLPSCFTKLTLYRRMCQELNKDLHISRSHFYQMMEKHLGHVEIPKVGYYHFQQKPVELNHVNYS